jgi:hypothetical protein
MAVLNRLEAILSKKVFSAGQCRRQSSLGRVDRESRKKLLEEDVCGI